MPTVKLAVAESEQRAIFNPQICTVFVQSLCINTLPAAMSHGGPDPFKELALLILALLHMKQQVHCLQSKMHYFKMQLSVLSTD